MMCAVSYLAGVVILEGWPVFLYLNSQFQGGEAGFGPTPVILGVSGAAVLTAIAVAAPLKAGISKVRTTDL